MKSFTEILFSFTTLFSFLFRKPVIRCIEDDQTVKCYGYWE